MQIMVFYRILAEPLVIVANPGQNPLIALL